MATDPRTIIEKERMSAFQWTIVAIMVGLNALDGFDVLSISFASPGIAKAWAVKPAALGVVLSMELVGMAMGSVILGNVADRIGRRATILGCLVVMAGGMFGASSAGGVVILCVWRVVTGLGIGGMLAVTNATVAEASNGARRPLSVVLMAAGYPVGAVVGGKISAMLLQNNDWPIVFQFGGLVTLAFIPLILWRVPESIPFLMHKRGPDTLARVNATLARMGHPGVDALPDADEKPARAPLAAIFQPALIATTVLLTFAYFAHVMTFYYIIKWIPKIVVDMGFAPPLAAGVLVWANVGGACGALLLGLLTIRIRVIALTIATMVASTVMVIIFGRGQSNLEQLALIAAIAGFFTNAGIVGLYALVAGSFPTAVRATATGFVIGVGRGGSALAPALAGVLFQAGYGLQIVSVIMALGASVGAVALAVLSAKRKAAGAQ